MAFFPKASYKTFFHNNDTGQAVHVVHVNSLTNYVGIVCLYKSILRSRVIVLFVYEDVGISVPIYYVFNVLTVEGILNLSHKAVSRIKLYEAANVSYVN